MSIFKRKKKLEKRIELLENFFGLFYHVYNEHKQDGEDRWTKLGKLEDRIKALEEAKKGKK